MGINSTTDDGGIFFAFSTLTDFAVIYVITSIAPPVKVFSQASRALAKTAVHCRERHTINLRVI